MSVVTMVRQGGEIYIVGRVVPQVFLAGRE